jgi:hypothetical protein
MIDLDRKEAVAVKQSVIEQRSNKFDMMGKPNRNFSRWAGRGREIAILAHPRLHRKTLHLGLPAEIPQGLGSRHSEGGQNCPW